MPMVLVVVAPFVVLELAADDGETSAKDVAFGLQPLAKATCLASIVGEVE